MTYEKDADELDDDLDLDDEDELEDDADLDDDEVVAEGDDDTDDGDDEEGDEDDEDAAVEDDEEGDQASLDEILARRAASRRASDDTDDDADLLEIADEPDEPAVEPPPVKLAPVKDEEEFVCNSCFLVKPRVQLADPDRRLCRDCV